ncbi:MAG: mechanosensitive ion channel family protein, partial [Verrucomicrobia bacterium]|nr:mechanosensitive ion channel family protein [Verrucomicrobiota bacterium]
DHRSLAVSVARGLLILVGLVVLIWALARHRRWLESRLIRLSARRADQLKSRTLRLVGLQNLAPVLRGLMTVVFWLILTTVCYLCLEYLLRLFPHTRPFGEKLGYRFVRLLGALGEGAMHALPGLGIVLVVWVLAKFASSSTRRFFTSVSRGTVKSRFFDAATAPISQRLCVFLIWITAIIVAFPYIPGSDTPAFRGITVLTGLMISLGSSSLIAQFVGGLLVVYNRTCRIGDYVRIGEHEGTLSSIGLSSSRLVTPRQEEIILPNSQLSAGALINFSRLNETVGVALPVKVSIGYGTPWRQVHALLLQAAGRTAGLKSHPEPKVLQTLLGDYAVEYTLNAVLENPTERVRVLSDLHGNIQDAFNDYGVQIMSPHYRADPAQPLHVPKENWHLPPAGSTS